MSKTRRRILLAASTAILAPAELFKRAHGMLPTDSHAPGHPYAFRNDPDHERRIAYKGVHEGKGTIDIKFFFRDEGTSKPALLLIYNIPPGASEGVHTHNIGDEKNGSYDEFYYIMEGSGEMQIDGKTVPVAVGDHIFTPNGISHGIENTATTGNLKVYLVAMIRD
ncbi:MAG: cupin domain-containing protein [Proteobacteria bacterium]|nr:cupin domain-containing protein [Pseudomonadota bacterium]